MRAGVGPAVWLAAVFAASPPGPLLAAPPALGGSPAPAVGGSPASPLARTPAVPHAVPETSCIRADDAADGVWAAPLDRPVTLRASEVSLRDALARVAAAADLRLSYSADLLRLDRGVCIDFQRAAAGAALTALVAGSPLHPVVASGGQVVLAPKPAAPSPDSVPMTVIPLERIVVTGTVAGGAERHLPVALSVFDAKSVDIRSGGGIAQALNGTAGVWLWEQPSTVFVRYGGIRGASSFGASYPKVYIDGIEVANPLLVSQLSTASLDRVEVIRGPQGSALYGSDAISGVANFVLRHDAPAAGERGTDVWTQAGIASSAFGEASLAQHHQFATRHGSATRSAAFGVDVSTLGEYVPGASSRDVTVTGTGRWVGSRALWTAVVRGATSDAERSANPLLTEVPGLADDAGAVDQSLRQITGGVTARFQPNEAWVHSVVVGLDSYSLDGAATADTPFPSAADSALEGTAGDATRLSVRANTVRSFPVGADGDASITLSAEHSELRQSIDLATRDAWVPEPPTDDRLPPEPRERSVDAWRGTTGVGLLARADLGNRLFLSGGIRLERNEAFNGATRETTLPMVGAAWVIERDAVVLKLRGAYGRGIRWPQTPGRLALWEPLRRQLATTGLEPEEQRGVEAGADLYLGDAVSLRVTRFDQLADGLLQRVAVAVDSTDERPRDRIGYVVQNVGEIENDGWELQATAAGLNGLSVSAALTLVDSRVRGLAVRYGGDLRPGDRMLEVPSATLGLIAGWESERWGASVSSARAFDWINYDRRALADAVASESVPVEQLVGRRLRAFWREYDGATRVRVTGTATLRPGLEARLTVDNLLDRQTGEPDNISIVPGRTVGIGLRVGF